MVGGYDGKREHCAVLLPIVVQLLSCVWLFVTPWIAVFQAPLSSTTPSSLQSLSRVWLCDLIDCSMPGFPVHHQLPDLLKLMFIKLVMPSSHLILCHPLLLLPSNFPSIRVFSNEFWKTLPSGGQSIGVSASASVLPMNIQDLFPLGLTGLISLQSRGFSRVFSYTTAQKPQFFGAQLSL